MVDPFNWNTIEGIKFQFKGNSPYDGQLNAVYSQIMHDTDMEDLFVESHTTDAKILAPSMMPNLRGSVANAITSYLPRLTKLQKGRITQLLSGCTISYITYSGNTKKVRGPIDLEKAVKDGISHHRDDSSKPIITIELNVVPCFLMISGGYGGGRVAPVPVLVHGVAKVAVAVATVGALVLNFVMLCTRQMVG